MGSIRNKLKEQTLTYFIIANNFSIICNSKLFFILIKIIALIYSFTYFEVENHLGLNHLISYYFLFILLLLYIKYYIIKSLKV